MTLDICVVASTLPPTIGGAERSIALFTRGLVEEGVRVYLVSGNQPEPWIEASVRDAGGTCCVIDSPARQTWEGRMFAASQLIADVLASRPLDVLHAFSHGTALSTAMALPAGHHPPFVATFHEMSSDQTEAGRRKSRFVYNLPHIQTIITLSDYFHDLARRYLEDPGKAVQCRQGLDLEVLSCGDARRGRQILDLPAETDRLTLLCPGRWVPPKGHADLLAALRQIRDRGQRVPLVRLVGSTHSAPHVDGQAHRRELVALAERLGLAGHVGLVDDIPADEMANAYAAVDAVVQPSHREGLGFVGVEAMACGRPFIASAVTGFLQYCVDDVNALVVPVQDPPALADAIARLGDPDLRARLVENGTKTAGAFDYRAGVRDVLAVYERVLAEAAPG